MKVLHLATHLNSGGITKYVLELVEPLERNDIELQVASSGGECAHLFEEKGVRVYALNIRTKNELHPKLYMSLPDLVGIIRREGIGALHAHTRVTQVMAHWARVICGVPVVTTCHGFYKNRLGRRLLPAWGDRVIAISEAVGADLATNFGVADSRIAVIPNGVNVSALHAAYSAHVPAAVKKGFGFGSDDPVLVIIARLVEVKGQACVINAVDRLRGTHPKIRLLIVGDGPDRDKLKERVRKLGLERHVVFTGTVKDITEPLAAADIFLLPATWREAFGLSIVEAMVCRKPVVVSETWALAGMLRGESGGILVDPNSLESVTAATDRLLRDPELREKMGSEGRRRVELELSVDLMARKISEVYGDISAIRATSSA
ncbi:MAG: glycosyltransferase family 4 protein [Candidatus Omnitrophota bacterium]|nr:glycosyltransferase family 4 protein [Candidatus Omnitrophota bacterium]